MVYCSLSSSVPAGEPERVTRCDALSDLEARDAHSERFDEVALIILRLSLCKQSVEAMDG